MSLRSAPLPHQWSRALVLGTLLMLACLGLQHISTGIAAIVRAPISFEHTAPHTWSAPLTDLAPGTYTFDAGRPRGLCMASIGNKVISSTVSLVPGLRSEMSFGGEFILPIADGSRLVITCEDESGFGPSLMHRPIITSHSLGAVVRGFRMMTELLLGPVASLVLAVVVAITRSRQHSRLLIFAFVSMIHGLSLAYFPRIFVPGFTASLIHILCKSAHQSAFIYLCATFLRNLRAPLLLSTLLGLGALSVALIAPQALESYYDRAYLLIPLSSLLVVLDLMRSDPQYDTHIILRVAAVAVLATQLMDAAVIWANVGVYSAPAVLAMMCFMGAFLAIRDGERRYRIERAVEEMTLIVTSGRSVPQIIQDLADRARGYVHFERISVYIDGFVIGMHDRPTEVFHRLAEFGYRKDTKPDDVVRFAERRGLKMLASISQDRPILGVGEVDKAFFVNVGIVRHACINFSDFEARPTYIVQESFEILSRMARVFEALAERFVDYGFRTSIALEGLRSIYGDGERYLPIGAIFADVNDYSTLTSRFGDGYSSFITKIYLTSLCKRLRPWAVREFSRGDEIYLVTVPELIEDEKSPLFACYQAILEIQNFTKGDGASLCVQHGYPPANMTVGANFGHAKVICDAMQVRTSGEMINQASRLKDSAGKGTTLIHLDMVEALAGEGIDIRGEDVTVLVKKSLVRARNHARGSKGASDRAG